MYISRSYCPWLTLDSCSFRILFKFSPFHLIPLQDTRMAASPTTAASNNHERRHYSCVSPPIMAPQLAELGQNASFSLENMVIVTPSDSPQCNDTGLADTANGEWMSSLDGQLFGKYLRYDCLSFGASPPSSPSTVSDKWAVGAISGDCTLLESAYLDGFEECYCTAANRSNTTLEQPFDPNFHVAEFTEDTVSGMGSLEHLFLDNSIADLLDFDMNLPISGHSNPPTESNDHGVTCFHK
jgi:hypothetical protein